MNSKILSTCILLLAAAMVLSACTMIGPLSIVPVSAPAINCVFDDDCTVPVTDVTGVFTPPFGTGKAFLQSRTFPRGIDETQAAGLYAYLYRIDMINTAGLTAISCVNTFSVEFGPIVSLDYDGDGALDNAFFVSSGGMGSLAPSSVDQEENRVRFTFEPAICPGSQVGDGDSSYFIGLTSAFVPTDVSVRLTGSRGLDESLLAHAPDFVASSEGAPSLRLAPEIGLVGQTITIEGSGYTPGGYPGTVLWDGTEIDVFEIPDGGAFSHEVLVPSNAQDSIHTVTVCALNPCATGEFEQLAGATFTVPGIDDGVVVWHAWQDVEKIVLEQYAADNPNGAVTLVPFGSEESLLNALHTPGNNRSPDLILGPNSWGDELLGGGIIDAYCVSNGCEACFGRNPPLWCPYAAGNFSDSLNGDFNLAGLCTGDDDCRPCRSPNPPQWCLAARHPSRIDIDLFQAGFVHEVDDELVPHGFPLWWTTNSVAADPSWFVENQVTLPASTVEIIAQSDPQQPWLRLLDPGFIDPIPAELQSLADMAKTAPAAEPNQAGVIPGGNASVGGPMAE